MPTQLSRYELARLQGSSHDWLKKLNEAEKEALSSGKYAEAARQDLAIACGVTKKLPEPKQ